MAASSAILPGVSMDGDPRFRYFGAGGCVEAQDDGCFAVYLGGSLIGRFSHRDPAERDALIVVAMQDPRSKTKRVAAAFGVSDETVRRSRVLARQGGLAAVTQRRGRGAPRKRTPVLRRKAFKLFANGLGIRATHRALAKVVSAETVRALYHEWKADRGDESGCDKSSVTREPSLPVTGVATDDAATELADASVAESTAAVEGVAEAEVETSEVTAAEKPVLPEQAPEQKRNEMSLEEAVRQSDGGVVQHVGSWLMLGMLQWLGVYALAKETCGRTVSPVALRVSLDAVAIALTVGQHCVEGVRRLDTPSAGTLLRSRGAVSASWARRVLGRFAEKASSELLLGIVARLLGRNEEADRVWLYVDNHMRPYTGKHAIRKGWRMQDKKARPGVSDYYVHDEEGRPLFRIDVPEHGSLTQWLTPIARFARKLLDERVEVCLCFDRGGAFPEQMAELRDEEGVGFVTYERAPYAQVTRTSFDRQFVLELDSKPKHPVVLRYTEDRQKNLGKGRGRVRRICVLMPDGAQINILTAGSTASAEELIRRQLGRWSFQENQFKHEVERWGINQLDGRKVRHYPPDAVIPSPARRRLDRSLRIARGTEGEARRKLARLDSNDPKRTRAEQDLEHALRLQRDLEALRPSLPTHAPLEQTELAGKLVYHPGEHKRVIDALRIALANSESELAARLAPHLDKPREAKKCLANLLAAPGQVNLTPRSVRVSLAPAGNPAERRAFDALLQEVNTLNLTLPGDTSHRLLRFELQT